MSVLAINANADNWIYVQPYAPQLCWVVDPSNASSVMQTLEKKGLRLTHILATHHHADHIGGICALKKAFSCTVLSPDPKRIPDTDLHVQDGQSLTLGEWTLTVLATPGHTTSSVCYYCTHPTESPVLFSGDTLFACGCGRLFEGTAEVMYRSLERLAALPEDTRLCPGHNYTEENVRFALSVEPDNDALKQMLSTLGRKAGFTATTLGQEKRCNPFLRVDDPSLRRVVGLNNPVEVFARLRRQKDNF
jgi:hydroxyacylglutathione hydrolase